MPRDTVCIAAKLTPPMSALGQKQTFGPRNAMSALPLKADIRYRDRHVRFVPKADILRRSEKWPV